MNRVKLLVLILIALLASSVLTACNPEDLEDWEEFLLLLEIIEVEEGTPIGFRVWDGAGNMLLDVIITGAESESAFLESLGALEQSNPVCDPITLEIYFPANPAIGQPEIVLLHMSEYTGELGPCPTAKPGPGPDMVPIPYTAVVGKFLSYTPLYFAPIEGATSGQYTMNAGQSLYVFGVDESGKFYKVLMSGQFFWVPVESMGPNYDDVWQGWPLPTDVVVD